MKDFLTPETVIMANSDDKLGGSKLELPVLDLDSIDDNFGLTNENKKSAGPVRRFTTNFKRGFLEQTKTGALMRQFARTALPDSYARAMAAVERSLDVSKDIGRAIERDAGYELESLLATTQRQLPRIQKYTPKKAYARIEERMEKLRARLREQLTHQANAARRPEDVQQSADEASLKKVLGAFSETLELQKELAQQKDQLDHERFVAAEFNRTVREQVSRKQLSGIAEQLKQLGDRAGRLLNYQEQITYRYQYQSLMMQTRSYFALRDIRKLLDVTLNMHRTAYDALVYNTGLPDPLKYEKGERTRTEVARRLHDNLLDRASAHLPDFLAGFMPQLQENLTRSLVGGVRNLGMASSMGGMAASMGGMGDYASTAGSVVGGGAANLLSSVVLPWLGRMARPGVAKLSERYGGGGHHLLAYWLNNAPALLQEYTQNLNQAHGWRGKIQELVRGVVPTYYLDDAVKDGSYQTIDRAATFNQLSQRSLVEIIPGYLSRILQEMRMLRTGRDDIEREVYDITKGEFVGFKQAQGRILGRVVNEVQRRNLQTTLDEVVNRYDPDQTLSPQARALLRERLLKDASSNKRFDPSAYASAVGYSAGADQATLDELQQFFSSQFEFDADGKLKRDSDNYRRLNQYSDAFLELRNVIPDARGELRRLNALGSQELIRDLGLIINTHGQDRINYDKLWELYQSDPSAQAGPVSPDQRTYAQQPYDYTQSEMVGPPRPSLWQRGKRDLRNSVEGAMRLRQGIGAGLSRANTALTDLYAKYGASPLLTVRGMERGDYIDLNTQKVIRSADDITGAVVDRYGFVVAKAEEVRDGLYSATGEQITKATAQAAEARAALTTHLRGLHRRSAEGLIAGLGWAKDLYTRGSEKAVLLLRDIRAGKYIDKNTDRVIAGPEDITGAVVDHDGNVVLTEEEFEEGLYDVEGSKLHFSRGRQLANRYLQLTTSPARFLGRTMFSLVKRTAAGLFNREDTPKDIYIEGEDTPRVTVAGLKRGLYVDADGKPLRSLRDITGAVYDRDGNQVLSADELSQTVDRAGRKHSVGKKPGLLRRAAGAYWRFTKNYYKGLWKLGLPIIGNPLARGGRKGKTEEVPEEAIQTPTDGLLHSILKVLKGRLPEEGPRKGSWQEIMARQKEEETESGAKDDVNTPRGFLKGLSANLSKLFNFFRRQGGPEDGDEDGDDGDTYIDADFGGDRDRKRRKDKNRGKPKGRIARGMDRAKQWMGRSRLGRAALGVGRVAAGAGRLAWGAGKLAFGLGSWAARGALMTGGALVSALGAPVVLGGLAVAGAVAGGVYLYRRHKQLTGVFKQYRLAQYGISPSDRKAALRVLALEELFEPAVNRRGENDPTFDMSQLDPGQILKILKIDSDNEADVAAMADWLIERFKPIYLTYHKALALHAPEVRVGEIDEKLPVSQGLSVLEAVSFPYAGDTPYAITASPMGAETPLSSTIDEIRQLEKVVEEHYRSKSKGMEAGAAATAAGAGAGAASVTAGSAGPVAQRGRPVQAPGAGVLPKPVPVPPVAPPKPAPTPMLPKAVVAATAAKVETAPLPQRMEVTIRARTDDQLSALQVIRLYAYGAVTLSQSQVSQLWALEEEVLQYVKLNGKGGADFATGGVDLVDTFGSIFGVSKDGSDAETLKNFNTWFNCRFLPVFLKYVIGINVLAPASPVLNSKPPLTASEQLQIAQRMVNTVVPYNREAKRIWDLTELPFEEPHLAQAESLAREELKNLEAEAAKVKAQLPPPAKAARPAEPAAVEVSRPVTPALQRAQQQWGVTPTVHQGAPAQPLVMRGNAHTQLHAGTGGLYEQVPMPKSNRSLQAALPTLQAVATMTGVSVDLLLTFASLESAFDYLIKASTSSATGWFQFINETWDAMVSEFGEKYGLPANDPGRRLRLDPRVNALMGAEFIKKNFKELQDALGRVPTDTDLYVAHFFGAADAIRFLQHDANAIAAVVFPKPASANRSIFFKPSGQPRTIGEVYALLDEKVARHRYGASGVNVQRVTANEEIVAALPANAEVRSDGSAVVHLGPEGMQGNVQPLSNPFLSKEQRTGSVRERAAGTVNPYNQVATGVLTTGVRSPADEETTSPVGVGQADTSQRPRLERDPVLLHQQELRRQARAADTRQKQQTEEVVIQNREMGRLMEQQLRVQESMRDYLKEIARTVGAWREQSTKEQKATSAAAPTSGEPSRPTSTAQSRQAGNAAAPVSMRR